MTTIIAAVDDDAVRRQVLDAAAVLAVLYRAEVQPVYVAGGDGTPPPIADDVGAPLRILLEGDVVDALVREIQHDDVVAAVIGARRPSSGAAPLGHVALEVATRVDRTLAIVPPDAPRIVPGQHLRALVPLDGTEVSALAVRAVVRRVADADVEIIVLHVFGDRAIPRFLDRPEHDLPAWAEEFRARWCAPGAAVEWRRGEPGREIVDVAREAHVDGIILGWGQELGGRAEAVRAVLASSGVPVILVPRAGAERTLRELGDPARASAAF